MHKIEEGIAEGAFGINVAEHVKIKKEIIERAKEIYKKANVNIVIE